MEEQLAVQEEAEWVCVMRRTMQELVPGVFLGPYTSAQPSRHFLLLQHGVTHIVSVRHDSEARLVRTPSPDKFHYLILNISDKPSENIICHFPVVKAFVDACLVGKGKVLIHGFNGNSRSAALAIAYIMETHGMTFQEAYGLVECKRFSICPNKGFVNQLAEYEPIYRAQQAFQFGHPKRPLEDDNDVSGPLKYQRKDI